MSKSIFMQELAAIIGAENASKLAAAKGGTKIYIPNAERLDEEHWLVQILGMEKARQLCSSHFRSCCFWLPLGPSSFRRRVQEKIKKHLAEGKNPRDVAILAGVHIRTVMRAKSRAEEADSSKTGRGPKKNKGEI